MMPVMDGWEFARSLGPDARPPIIVLSADRNVSTKAKEIGALGWLAKPFELTDLLAVVRRAVPSEYALTRRVARRYGPPRVVDS